MTRWNVIVAVYLCITRLPLYKYAGLDGMDDAAEARFFFVAS